MERLAAPELPGWLDEMVPFDRYLVDIGPYRMHVMEVGEGLPVLLLHGNPSWGFIYRKVAKLLEGAELRLIMPDLIGLGFSDKPMRPAVHTLRGHADWIRRLIDQLDLEQVILVGQDWGGPIGLLALAERPDLAAGMVLLNTVVGPPRVGFKATWFHRFANMPIASTLAFRGLGFPQNAMRTAQGDKKSITGKVSKAYRYPIRGFRRNAAPLAMARMVPNSPQHPSFAALERCQAYFESFEGPLELVWGDKDPVLGRVRGWIEKLKPGVKVHRTNAGHFLQEEVPDVIAGALRSVAGAVRSSQP
jgi:haloalkane dehalogenase